MSNIRTKFIGIPLLMCLSLVGCDQPKKGVTPAQDTQNKKITTPDQTPSQNTQRQAENDSIEERDNSDVNSSADSTSPIITPNDVGHEDEEKKVKDILVLIHSLKLPKRIEAKLESHPLYYDILKLQKYERIVFQDSLIFGKYRCKKMIEFIKSKNVNSKLLKNFNELNLCDFNLVEPEHISMI